MGQGELFASAGEIARIGLSLDEISDDGWHAIGQQANLLEQLQVEQHAEGCTGLVYRLAPAGLDDALSCLRCTGWR